MANKIRLQFPLQVDTKQSPLPETSFDDVENIIVSREVEVEKEVYLENYKNNVSPIQRMMTEWSNLIAEQLAKQVDQEYLKNMNQCFLPSFGSHIKDYLTQEGQYAIDSMNTTIEDGVIRMDVTMRPVQEYITINLGYTIDPKSNAPLVERQTQ